MKQSGINYFINLLGIDTGDLGAFYTFEEGTGTLINSISGGDIRYSGILGNATNFWNKPGSGFSNGSPIVVQNANELFSNGWTQIFVYEKVNADSCLLFTSQSGLSGYSIGLTSSNKPYFESNNNGGVVGVSSNSYSSKNIVSISYLPNYVSIGCYNVNSKILEQESFDYYFNVAQSDNWKLLPNFTGYIDYWLYFKNSYSKQVLGQLMSGFGFYPTGQGFDVQTIIGTGVTGYSSGIFTETGITGYQTFYDIGQGYIDYSGVFPGTGTISVPISGVVNSGYTFDIITGLTTQYLTGAPITLFEIKTGYLSSFGMEKIQVMTYIDGLDVIKDSYSRTLFDDVYNKTTTPNYSGFDLDNTYTTGDLNVFLNGISQGNTGWILTGSYMFISGTDSIDTATFDIKSGSKLSYLITGLSYYFPFIGQEIFINGVNLISGLDFTVNGGSAITLTTRNTGINGQIFENPVVLTYSTGTFSMKTGEKFNKNTSNIYLNGVREQLDSSYLEGAIFDNMSGNNYNNLAQYSIYDNSNLFWE